MLGIIKLSCAEARVDLTCTLRPSAGLSKKHTSYIAHVRVTDGNGHSEELRLFVAAKSTADRKRSTKQGKKVKLSSNTEADVCRSCGK